MTTFTASSNTFFKPRWVRAEHSIYLTALILLAIFMPCSLFTGLWPIWASCESVSRSSRRSVLVPTRIIGTSGQWWRISGTHFTWTFSSYQKKTQKQLASIARGHSIVLPMAVRQQRSTREKHRSVKEKLVSGTITVSRVLFAKCWLLVGMTVDADDHNLLDRRYPRGPVKLSHLQAWSS